MMKINLSASSTFSLMMGLLVAAALAAANAHYLFPGPMLGKWDSFLKTTMLGYLLFISLRTGILIILSFADRFFHVEFHDSERNPLVSILVPCFNEEIVVRHAIDALQKIDYPNLEIIIIDDGSTDSTLLTAKKLELKHKVRIIHQRNQGKAEALNRGLDEALGEYVLCVDADGALSKDVVKRSIGYLERDPGLAAVAGNVMVGNTRSSLGLFQKLEYVSGLNIHKGAQSFLGAVNIVPGPVGLFRKSAVQKIGGYRSTSFAEDCDLTIRLLMEGNRIVYCPEMIAVTEAPEDFTSLLKQRYRWARGTIQAVKQNAKWFYMPFAHPRNFFILTYFTVETLLLPTVNFLFSIAFIEHATITGDGCLMGPFFVQLILLNIVLSTYAVCFENGPVRLILLSIINPLTYGLAMELIRFLSLFDELMGLPMSWNKLARTGSVEGKINP